MPNIEQQYRTIIKKLEQIERGGAEPVRPSIDIEENLRAAAADWMETKVGYAYGRTVLDILEGR